MNANEEMLAGNQILILVILRLLNLNTGYADTHADFCVKIMSFCYKQYLNRHLLHPSHDFCSICVVLATGIIAFVTATWFIKESKR